MPVLFIFLIFAYQLRILEFSFLHSSKTNISSLFKDIRFHCKIITTDLQLNEYCKSFCIQRKLSFTCLLFLLLLDNISTMVSGDILYGKLLISFKKNKKSHLAEDGLVSHHLWSIAITRRVQPLAANFSFPSADPSVSQDGCKGCAHIHTQKKIINSCFNFIFISNKDKS